MTEEKRNISKNATAILLFKDQEEWFNQNPIYNRSQIIREGVDEIIKKEDKGEAIGKV